MRAGPLDSVRVRVPGMHLALSTVVVTWLRAGPLSPLSPLPRKQEMDVAEAFVSPVMLMTAISFVTSVFFARYSLPVEKPEQPPIP